MTSKYFGEFLVEREIISEDNLVNALVEQIANTPPLCQVIYKHKIISTPKIFEAFRFQQDHQVEFMQACISIGVWNKEVQEKVYLVLDEIRRPLGHILVSKGLIDLKKLTMMLDEFLSKLSSEPLVVDLPAAVSVPVQEKVIIPEEADTSSDGFEVLTYQPGILMELEETFDEKKRRIVKVALSLIKDNAANDQVICKKLFQDVFKILHSLNGLLGLLALDKLSELLENMENYINQILNQIPGRSAEQLIEDTQLLILGIEMGWSLRGSLMEHSSEAIFFKDKSNQQKFSNLINSYRV